MFVYATWNAGGLEGGMRLLAVTPSDLSPVLEIPGAVIAGALSSYGVALGSLTWNLRDVAVKGHLPKSETARVTGIFAEAPAGAVRILTFHHNVLRGGTSGRMGLANWRSVSKNAIRSSNTGPLECTSPRPLKR